MQLFAEPSLPRLRRLGSADQGQIGNASCRRKPYNVDDASGVEAAAGYHITLVLTAVSKQEQRLRCPAVCEIPHLV